MPIFGAGLNIGHGFWKIVGIRTVKFLSSYPGSSDRLRHEVVEKRIGRLLSQLPMMQIATPNKYFPTLQMALRWTLEEVPMMAFYIFNLDSAR